MGVIIDDPQLGADFVADLESALPYATWEAYLNNNNRLAWKETNSDATTHYTKEPMTNWWQRFKAGVYRLLPIRSQL